MEVRERSSRQQLSFLTSPISSVELKVTAIFSLVATSIVLLALSSESLGLLYMGRMLSSSDRLLFS